MQRQTAVTIDGEKWIINGEPTYKGKEYRGHKIEGLLLNSRMIQATFDDENEITRVFWPYPDTGKWDPERNTDEFVAAMPEWRAHGLLGITIGLQGGSPSGYYRVRETREKLKELGITEPEEKIWAGLPGVESQPWLNSAFAGDGSLKQAYLSRLTRVLDKADDLGMVVLLNLFYFGQDERLVDEAAVTKATEQTCSWVLQQGYTNVVIDLVNECDLAGYEHEILRRYRVHELLEMIKTISHNGRRLLRGTSYAGGRIPDSSVVGASDFVLMHGNGVREPARIAQMADWVRTLPTYKPMPVLITEDDHYEFDNPENNLTCALSAYASWGYFDPGKASGGRSYFTADYQDGFQTPPINWWINTPRKKAFFDFLADVTGSK